MARIIDDRRPRWWAFTSNVCCGVVVPLVAAVLFVRETISTVGFVALLAGGIAGMFLLDRWIMGERRRGIEIAPGKAFRQRKSRPEAGIQEFKEDALHYVLVAMLAVPLAFVLLLESLKVASDSPRPAGGYRMVPLGVAVLLIMSALVLRMRRICIEGDLITVGHPFLGDRWHRSFRLGEISSAELREVGRGHEVRIRLHDGSLVSYPSWDESKLERLLEALKRGIAEAKPVARDWDELA